MGAMSGKLTRSRTFGVLGTSILGPKSESTKGSLRPSSQSWSTSRAKADISPVTRHSSYLELLGNSPAASSRV